MKRAKPQLAAICPFCRGETYKDGTFGHGEAKLVEVDALGLGGPHSETYEFEDKRTGSTVSVKFTWS